MGRGHATLEGAPGGNATRSFLQLRYSADIEAWPPRTMTPACLHSPCLPGIPNRLSLARIGFEDRWLNGLRFHLCRSRACSAMVVANGRLRFGRSSFLAVRDCRLVLEVVGRYFLLSDRRHDQKSCEQYGRVNQTWFLYKLHNLLRPTGHYLVLLESAKEPRFRR